MVVPRCHRRDQILPNVNILEIVIGISFDVHVVHHDAEGSAKCRGIVLAPGASGVSLSKGSAAGRVPGSSGSAHWTATLGIGDGRERRRFVFETAEEAAAAGEAAGEAAQKALDDGMSPDAAEARFCRRA